MSLYETNQNIFSVIENAKWAPFSRKEWFDWQELATNYSGTIGFNLLPRTARLQINPAKQAPCENPIRPWNGPSTRHASSTINKLVSNPNAGPFRLVPLNVSSSLLNHQLFSTNSSVFEEESSEGNGCVESGTSLTGLGTSWGAVINTNSA